MINSAIYNRLKNNTDLTDLLAKIDDGLGGTFPAIYKLWAEEDSPFPYIVYRLTESKIFEHPYKSEFTLYIDIWDYNEDSTKLSQEISDIIKKEFNFKRMEHNKYGAMQSWMMSRGQQQSDLKGMSHMIHQFTVHAWDKEF